MPIHDLFAEGDRVAAYLVFEGTHMCELMDVVPKGHRIRSSLLMWLTLRDGKIVDKRAHFDAADAASWPPDRFWRFRRSDGGANATSSRS